MPSDSATILRCLSSALLTCTWTWTFRTNVQVLVSCARSVDSACVACSERHSRLFLTDVFFEWITVIAGTRQSLHYCIGMLGAKSSTHLCILEALQQQRTWGLDAVCTCDYSVLKFHFYHHVTTAGLCNWLARTLCKRCPFATPWELLRSRCEMHIAVVMRCTILLSYAYALLLEGLAMVAKSKYFRYGIHYTCTCTIHVHVHAYAS
jgi:hypothetical protein